MRNYTPRQVKRAKIAREQMSVLGFPTQKDHERYIENNLIHNSPVTIEDIRIAHVEAICAFVYDRESNAIPEVSTRNYKLYYTIAPLSLEFQVILTS